MPSGPPSRPKPDCLTPPNGAPRVGDHALVEADHPGLEPLDDAEGAVRGRACRRRRRGRTRCRWRRRSPRPRTRSSRRARPARRSPRSSSRAPSGTSLEHGRLVEVARAVDAAAPPTSELGALRARVVDELGDLAALGGVDERADVDVGLGAAPDLERAHPLGEPARELAGHRARRRGSGWPRCTPRRCCASSRSSRPRRRRRGRRPRRRGTARCRRAPSTRAGSARRDCSMSVRPTSVEPGERELARPRVADQGLHRPRPSSSP